MTTSTRQRTKKQPCVQGNIGALPKEAALSHGMSETTAASPSKTDHPLLPGTAGIAYSAFIARRPLIEGRLEILSPIAGEPNLYLVRFVGEALPQVRFVHPDWQRDPTRTLEILKAYWRLNCDAALHHAIRIRCGS